MTFPNETVEHLVEILEWQINESKSFNEVTEIKGRLEKSNLPPQCKERLLRLAEKKGIQLINKLLAFASI